MAVFYTGSLFKLERLLLAWIASRPSTDEQAKELACGIRVLAHEGRRVMSMTFPGAEPPMFIVIGETPQLSELLAAANRELRSEK